MKRKKESKYFEVNKLSSHSFLTEIDTQSAFSPGAFLISGAYCMLEALP